MYFYNKLYGDYGYLLIGLPYLQLVSLKIPQLCFAALGTKAAALEPINPFMEKLWVNRAKHHFCRCIQNQHIPVQRLPLSTPNLLPHVHKIFL